ncbi:hypothetical protein MRS44_013484 [Fusarium solani]|uniref:uncharacterized protein n=1 Tax=Fusarium solani TaxID=169388 RepID=UPI0032C4A47D|nr:hypothetical protein MRS44_013484 [Fusarium solani]
MKMRDALAMALMRQSVYFRHRGGIKISRPHVDTQVCVVGAQVQSTYITLHPHSETLYSALSWNIYMGTMATEMRAQIDNKSNVGLHFGISNASPRHPEPCFEGETAASYQRQIAAEANAPDTSTLGGRHANGFTRQTVKTGRTVAQLRSEKNGSLKHDSILRATEEANTGSAPTRNKFLDEDGELYLPTIAELRAMSPEDWRELYAAFDSQGARSHRSQKVVQGKKGLSEFTT